MFRVSWYVIYQKLLVSVSRCNKVTKKSERTSYDMIISLSTKFLVLLAPGTTFFNLLYRINCNNYIVYNNAKLIVLYLSAYLNVLSFILRKS